MAQNQPRHGIARATWACARRLGAARPTDRRRHPDTLLVQISKARAGGSVGLAPRGSKRAISAMRVVGRVIVYHQSHWLGRSNVVPAGATSR